MSDRSLIVVADSDAPRRARTAVTLAEAGYRVREADDATTAETFAAEGAAAVVLDARVRGGAADLIVRLRADARTAATRLVVVVDPADQTPATRARLAAADACLVRPIELRSVVACLAALEAESELAGRVEDDGVDLAGFFESADARTAREAPLLAALTDPVTGLWNAAYTDLKLGDEYKKARRFRTPLSCLVAAPDAPFPNTAQGRADRRRILSDLAGVLLCESRDVDHLARLDYERFLAILPHTDAAGAEAMATRVARSIERRALLGGKGGAPLTVSAGVATFTGDEAGSGEEIVQNATSALDHARREGLSRVVVWAPVATPVRDGA